MTYIYILEREGVPFYVGKTNSPIRRKHKHHSKYGKGVILDVIDEVDKKEWKFWESYWIEQFKTWGFKLENKNKGGGGPGKYSELSKIKMRKPRKKGTGDKISKSLIKGNHPQYYTKKVRDKISKGNKDTKKPFTKEHKVNMGIAKRKNAKPVIQMDLNNNFIKEWESKGQAAEFYKKELDKESNLTSQIKDCILGKQKTSIGFKWKYKI